MKFFLRSLAILLVSALITVVARVDDGAISPRVTKVIRSEGKQLTDDAQRLLRECERQPLSPGELWALWDRLIEESQRIEPPDRYRCWFSCQVLAATICRAGDPADFERLLAHYDHLSSEEGFKPLLAVPLTQAVIEREVVKIAADGRSVAVVLPPVAAAMPDAIRRSPPRVQQAWEQSTAIKENCEQEENALTKQVKCLSVQDNWPSFYRAIGAAWRGQSEGAARELARYQWTGMCGTGSGTMFSSPKYRALLAAWLRERRLVPAIGALLALTEVEGDNVILQLSRFDDWNWRQQLFGACGLDWESIYAGRAAALDQGWPANAWLRPLARHGSPRAATLLIEMQHLPVATSESYLEAVAAFVAQPQKEGIGFDFSGEIKRVNQEPVSLELQRELLAILTGAVQENMNRHRAETLARIFNRLRRPETRDALHKLLVLPYSSPRREAEAALRAMGEDRSPQSEPKRTVFRFVENARPCARTRINWEIHTEHGYTSSTETTDANGCLALPRDNFLDTGSPATFVRFRTTQLTTPDDLWFRADVVVPTDLDSTNDVAITTSSLAITVACQRDRQFSTNQPIFARLEIIDPKTALPDYPRVATNVTLGAVNHAVFPRLQEGKYKAELFAPGYARWESDTILVGRKSATLQATLETGADLNFEILAPGGDERDRHPHFELLRNNKPVRNLYAYAIDFDGHYHGLPAGQYSLQILSSTMKPNPSFLTCEPGSPNSPPYLGEEREFQIDDRTPTMIDLGVICLRPADTR